MASAIQRLILIVDLLEVVVTVRREGAVGQWDVASGRWCGTAEG
jgi:hypothetical protein